MKEGKTPSHTDLKVFEVKQDHLTLLKHAKVRSEVYEGYSLPLITWIEGAGVFSLSSLRNNSLHSYTLDRALKVLNMQPEDTGRETGKKMYSAAQYEHVEKLLKEITTVLQICLQKQAFMPGQFLSDEKGNWHKATNKIFTVTQDQIDEILYSPEAKAAPATPAEIEKAQADWFKRLLKRFREYEYDDIEFPEEELPKHRSAEYMKQHKKTEYIIKALHICLTSGMLKAGAYILDDEGLHWHKIETLS